jgi:hypothetical protein
MRSIQLSIPEPCQEKWEFMTPADQGRFCSSCNKVILDFSKKSDREIVNLFNNNSATICAKVPNSKLNVTLSANHDFHENNLSLKALLIGTALITNLTAWSIESPNPIHSFSLTEILAQRSDLIAQAIPTDTSRIAFQFIDVTDQMGAPFVKVFLYTNTMELVAGAKSDFDGYARFNLSKEDLDRVATIHFESFEYEIPIFVWKEGRDYSDVKIEVTPFLSGGATIGIIYPIEPKKQSRKLRRQQRRFDKGES